MPGGGPRIGGIPGIMPGGGAMGRICGGAATWPPRPRGAICANPGPPTPRTGPWSPAGTAETFAGIPRPAARPTPGPEALPGRGTRGSPCSGGGGPSTVNETIFSPRSSTKPSTRFSSRSGSLLFFGRIFLNSSQSPRIRFMCLSNALKVPMKVRESCKMIRTR